MRTTDAKPSSAWFAETNPEAAARYKEMRALLMPAPGVAPATCEMVLAMQLAVLGHEVPFKVHAMRAMAQGMALEELQGLLLASVGVSMIVPEAARALAWLQEACEEMRPST